MSLKPKKSQAPSEPLNQKDELHGPWGRINPGSPSFDVLRFSQRENRTHSYPYRVLSSWHWTDGPVEELRIEAGADLVTIRGRGLDRIVEALDRGVLAILREIPGEAPAKEDAHIWVSTIVITGAQSNNEN